MHTTTRASGFTLIELMLALTLFAVVAAIAVPTARTAIDGMQLGMATREVAQQFQTARFRAVSANRPMVVRLNCPAPGQLRMVEVTGLPAVDQDANRCDDTRFPFPGPRDADPATPAQDGPLRRLPISVTVEGSDVQFFPNGTAQSVVGGTPRPMTSPVDVVLARDGDSSTISINGLGKIDAQ